MKRIIYLMLLCFMQPAIAQIAINNVANPPHASAMLDITSTTKGLLAPRMTQVQRDAILVPATGLLIYQTDNVPGFYYNAGTPAAKNWVLVGQNLSHWGTNGPHIYNTNAGNVGIGTTAPVAPLEITSLLGPQLVITGGPNVAERPGIQFKNNNTHFISGDDSEDELFGFYARFGSTRTHGASLNVYGPAAATWGNYIGLKHDGTKGYLSTDVGDLILLKGPGGHVGIGTAAPTRYVTIDAGALVSEIQFVNSASGKTANDGASIGVHISTPHASFWNYENADLYFGTNNLRRLTIKADGKIGMGVSLPEAALHVQYNSTAAVPGLLLTETDDDYTRLMFKNTLAPSKNWLINAGINATDSYSRFNISYLNGSSTREMLALTNDGEVQLSHTGDANMMPIAYGRISYNGSKVVGTNNFTSSYNSSLKAFEISIQDVSLYENFVAVITVGRSIPFFSGYSTVEGKLLVFIFDKDGNATNQGFSFVVYKP